MWEVGLSPLASLQGMVLSDASHRNQILQRRGEVSCSTENGGGEAHRESIEGPKGVELIASSSERDQFTDLINIACRGIRAPLTPASGERTTFKSARGKRIAVPRTPIASAPVDMTNFANGISTLVAGSEVSASFRSINNAATILRERFGMEWNAIPPPRHAKRSGMPYPPSPTRRTFAKAFRSKPFQRDDTRVIERAYPRDDSPAPPRPKIVKFIRSSD